MFVNTLIRHDALDIILTGDNMSDFSDLCEDFGLSANDPEAIEKIIENVTDSSERGSYDIYWYGVD